MLIATLVCGSEPENYEELCKTLFMEKKRKQKDEERKLLVTVCVQIVDSITSGDCLTIPRIMEMVMPGDSNAIYKKILLLPKSIGSTASTILGRSNHDLSADALTSYRSRKAEERLPVVNQQVDDISHYSYESMSQVVV
jgi:hypothetical protein